MQGHSFAGHQGANIGTDFFQSWEDALVIQKIQITDMPRKTFDNAVSELHFAAVGTQSDNAAGDSRSVILAAFILGIVLLSMLSVT